jgi:hypothetical protein
LIFGGQTLQDGFFVRFFLTALSRPPPAPPPSLEPITLTEKLQAFLVNYLDPETDQLKYLIQLVRKRERERFSRPRDFRRIF